MENKLSGKYFYDLKKIAKIEKCDCVISNYIVKNDYLDVRIDFKLDYLLNTYEKIEHLSDHITLKFYIDEELIINNVTLDDVEHYVYDNQGVEFFCNVAVDTRFKNESINIETNTEETLEESIEHIEKEISSNDESIDEIIIKNTRDEQDNYRAEVIDSVIEEDEYRDELVEEFYDEDDEFYEDNNYFFDLEEKYDNYKIIFINDESELEEISRKYNKPLADIYKENNYEIENRVVIRIEE